MLSNARLEVDMTLGDILKHAILWLVVSIITVGIAFFFFPYSIAANIFKHVYIVDQSGKRIGQLQCNMDFSSRLGHILLWIVISILTLGIGSIVYAYKTWIFVLEHTSVVTLDAATSSYPVIEKEKKTA